MLMKLPNSLSRDFFNLFTLESELTFPDAKIAVLSDFPVGKIQSLVELDESEMKRTNMDSKLFLKKKQGETVIFNKTLMKLNLAGGSNDSLTFLRELMSVNPTNDLFLTKVIDNIIKYKFQKVKIIAYMHFFLYLIYLCCVISQYKYAIIPWTAYQTFFELI